MIAFRRYIVVALFTLLAFGLGGCDSVDNFFFKPDYKISGVEKDAALQKDLDGFLKTRTADIKKPKNPKESQAQSAYQASLLQNDLADDLRAKGYYDSTVSYVPGAKDWSGTYRVTPGVIYKIATVTLKPEAFKKYYGHVALLKGQALDAVNVLAAEAALSTAVQKDGCYFTLDVTHEVLLDVKAKTANVAFSVAAGPKASFGPALFKNNVTVKDEYLAKMVPWKEGHCFRRDQVEALRTSLFETGLFSRADLELPKKPAADGSVPVTLDLKERPPRSVSAGLSYYTDEGPGVELSWKHRNFFGGGENVEANLKVSQLLQSLQGKYTIPYFLRRDQSLSFTSDLSREDSDAYVERGLNSGVALKRVFSKKLSGTTGVSLDIDEIDDKTLHSTDTYALVSFPNAVTYDSRDNALDARHGWLLDGSVEPFIDALGNSPAFWKTEGAARTYLPLGKDFTLAGRVKAGSLLGPSTVNVPATKRYYAGGGGSVRGFGYQEVGPQDAAGKPTGGRSLAEASIEARYKITETIGAVAFLDAGSVSETSVPNLDDLSVGTGLGLRYYTGFGPLRLDVGVPVNNKDKADSSYQLYISIGQAF